MLFGKSLFQSVVDRLEAEHEEEPSPEPTVPRRVGLKQAFVAESNHMHFSDVDLRQEAYLFLMPEAEPFEDKEPEPPAIPEWIDRLDTASIADDLAISTMDGREALQEKRRAFAKENHPDRVHPTYRNEATIRMMTANRLIDDALSRCPTAS
ncbi:hypothetical protein FE840_001375 [Peteryoungia desertarenae]|uniref:J domain-containing protein n=1 Tax=Peteryoungia desertarenae TaxID=1813451 RepID=A0ABX6QJ53_9HYPH|nr:hypothetical protein [Peteryoungia desertarenae]QLF68312.1 hypothetical protein FE840_001375 [Peteryoungia desertarenae]